MDFESTKSITSKLFVPAWHQAAEWYRRVLGLEVVAEYEYWAEDPEGPLMISSDAGNTKLAVFQGMPQGPRETAGFHVAAFRVAAARRSRPSWTGFRIWIW